MPQPILQRKVSLLQGTAINMIDMVGIGPFVVMPMVMAQTGPGTFLWAWILGAVISLLDGMIWSELGAAYPLAGGTYNFLNAAYGPKWGKMSSFLYIWQTCIQAPLVMASAAIGFAKYFGYIVPLDDLTRRLVSGGVVILVVLLLYRRIDAIGKISVLLWAGVLATIGGIIFLGFTHRTLEYHFIPEEGVDFFSYAFWAMMGGASVNTIYSYLGYYNVCHIGGEIKNPQKNIPRSIFISIFGIALLYICMNLAITGVLSYQEASNSRFIASTFVEKLYGREAAMVATGLVLWVAFASLFALTLGYSRVPYAAAADKNFFPIFARLHPKKNFPYVSLLFMGGLGFIFSLFFRMDQVIAAILAMRVLVQFVAQAIGVMVLRKRQGKSKLPFKMGLYPIPVILTIVCWVYLFFSTGWFALWGLAMALLGLAVYFLTRKLWKTDKDQ